MGVGASLDFYVLSVIQGHLSKKKEFLDVNSLSIIEGLQKKK